MSLSEYFPSFGEFRDNITSSSIPSDDLAFQKKMALKAGYKSWQEYLQYIYDKHTIFIDFKAIVDEIGKDFDKTNRLTVSFPLILNKNKNTSLQAKKKAIFKKVDTFSLQEKNKIWNIEEGISKYFFIILIDKYKQDKGLMDFLLGIFNDIQKQYEFIDLDYSNYFKKAILYIEAVLLTETNNVLQQQTSFNFYFPTKAHLLKKLHDKLLEAEFIYSNDDFEKSFALKNRPKDIKATRWRTEATRLFYLLYKLNDKTQLHANKNGHKINIYKIAMELFIFKNHEEREKVYDNFVKAFNKFDDDNYINGKMLKIEHILIDLHLE